MHVRCQIKYKTYRIFMLFGAVTGIQEEQANVPQKAFVDACVVYLN